MIIQLPLIRKIIGNIKIKEKDGTEQQRWGPDIKTTMGDPAEVAMLMLYNG